MQSKSYQLKEKLLSILLKNLVKFPSILIFILESLFFLYLDWAKTHTIDWASLSQKDLKFYFT